MATSTTLETNARLAVTAPITHRTTIDPDDGLPVVEVAAAANAVLLGDEALPLVVKLASIETFSACDAVGWLGGNFTWAEVGPLLQGLVDSGILRVV